MKICINTIKFNRSLVDGPGVRTVLFLQGCDLHCKGCQNQSTWDIKKGEEIEISDLIQVLKENIINKKITISGGEPLMQKQALLVLCKELKNLGFDIAVYTGHDASDVPEELYQYIKYIKTGRFIETKKTTVKAYVGSTNQEFRRVKNEAEM